jgi:hypothetical protein
VEFKVGDLIQHKPPYNNLHHTFLILKIEQQKTKTVYELQRPLDNKILHYTESIQYPNDFIKIYYIKINHHKTKLGKILYKAFK